MHGVSVERWSKRGSNKIMINIEKEYWNPSIVKGSEFSEEEVVEAMVEYKTSLFTDEYNKENDV